MDVISKHNHKNAFFSRLCDVSEYHEGAKRACKQLIEGKVVVDPSDIVRSEFAMYTQDHALYNDELEDLRHEIFGWRR